MSQAFPMDGIGRLGHDPPRGPSADWGSENGLDSQFCPLDNPYFFRAKIRVDKCSNEALLCECCFMLIQDDAGVGGDNVLEALQILFSRGNVDPKILIQALQRLENVITEHDDLDTEKLNHVNIEVATVFENPFTDIPVSTTKSLNSSPIAAE
ncbi:hypothetical protein evm_010807 [Chilo suppressalis]|nr:hypothetical protein evm_010807 [Chilo suppressalis]